MSKRNQSHNLTNEMVQANTCEHYKRQVTKQRLTKFTVLVMQSHTLFIIGKYEDL